jgi:hypothetical protein
MWGNFNHVSITEKRRITSSTQMNTAFKFVTQAVKQRVTNGFRVRFIASLILTNICP